HGRPRRRRKRLGREVGHAHRPLVRAGAADLPDLVAVRFRFERRLSAMTSPDATARRAVIVVSSHVARGAIGNRAAVFALESLGFPVWAVPTVVLPWHPGHGPATRIVPEPEQFSGLMGDLAAAPWLGEVGAVLSGYLGDASQAEAIAALVRAV